MPALLLALLFVLAPLTAIAQADSPVDCGAPAAAADGWQVAAPAAVGLDPATLCGIGSRFKAWTAAKIDAVLVIRHGKLIYEQYFASYGNPFFGTITFDSARKHDLHSITKSITALVLGIEIGKGRIAGIDQPVLLQLPDYADLRSPEKDQITLRHLLTMSQGLAWSEDIPFSNPVNSYIQMRQAPDPVRFVLAQPVEVRPGIVFNYSGGSATVIAALLRKTTGQTVDTLARTDLFEPPGITDVQWDLFPPGRPQAR
jgi:CubicO group peptidase (beta-lactamase class C family)